MLSLSLSRLLLAGPSFLLIFILFENKIQKVTGIDVVVVVVVVKQYDNIHERPTFYILGSLF
jgi:hypothetical protein